MRFSIIKIVFLKELREMLRDRRSLTIMFGIPLVLYPVLTILIGTIGVSKKKQFTETPAKVAIINPTAAPQLVRLLGEKESGVEIIPSADPQADLANLKVDAIVDIPPHAEADALANKPPLITTKIDRSR